MGKIHFLFALSALVWTGCATMSVKVSVINQKKLKEMPGVIEAEVNRTEQQIYQNLSNDIYYKQKYDLITMIDTVLADSILRANIDTSTIKEMAAGARGYINKTFQDAIADFHVGLQLSEQARADSNNEELLLKARSNFAAGNNLLKELANKLNKNFDGISSGPLSVLMNISPEDREKETQKIYSLIQGADILGDPLTSFVVKTGHKKKYWKGAYNKTITKNGFGNSDVAIAMESLGNFTIKGVRLDAANVVAASFKTLSQSIQFLSAVYGGVPSSVKSADTETPAPVPDYNKRSDVDAKQKELEIQSRLSRLSSIAIMDAILSRRNDLEDATKLPDAVTSIKTTFEIYKPQLNLKK